jgi:hypothetical protein
MSKSITFTRDAEIDGWDIHVDGTFVGAALIDECAATPAARWAATINRPEGNAHATGRTRKAAVEAALAKAGI